MEPDPCVVAQDAEIGYYVFGLYNTSAGQSTGGSDGRYSVPSEYPQFALDHNLSTKYFNFGNDGNYGVVVEQAGQNTGFIVVAANGMATVANGLRFATANDNPNRDPIGVTLEGSNKTDNVSLAMGSSWTLLYNGSTGISAFVDSGRETYVSPQWFNNAVAFISYRLLITSQRGADNGVQYSEAQILGKI
jgi:hypothetical protein